MSLYFDDEIQKSLAILINAQPQVLVDFCKLALDYIRNGPNAKRYQIAAQKLETTVDIISDAVTALLKLLCDGCKYSLSSEGFVDAVRGLGWSAESSAVLGRLYDSRRTELTAALSELASPARLLSYADLHWRLETQVASRSAEGRGRTTSALALRLSGPGGDPRAPRALRASLPALLRLTAALGAAQRDSRTFHIRRMQRVLEQ